MNNLPAHNSMSRTANMPAVSLREKSSQDLIQAIHSPNDPGYTVDRVRICLKLYFDPDMDAQDRADMLDLFAKALSPYPKWAVAKAFDAWEKTGTRRPSPGEIGNLAGRAVKELTDILAARDKAAPQPEPKRDTVSKKAADAIMAAAGFTPKRIDAIRAAPMATSIAEAETRLTAPAQKVLVEGSPEWRAVQAARDANPIIQEMRVREARAKGDEA